MHAAMKMSKAVCVTIKCINCDSLLRGATGVGLGDGKLAGTAAEVDEVAGERSEARICSAAMCCLTSTDAELKLSTKTPTKMLSTKKVPTRMKHRKNRIEASSAPCRGPVFLVVASTPLHMISGQLSWLARMNMVRTASPMWSKLMLRFSQLRGVPSSSNPTQSSLFQISGSLQKCRRPLNSCTPRMPKMKNTTRAISAVLSTGPTLPVIVWTTIRRPRAREITRRGRRARKMRNTRRIRREETVLSAPLKLATMSTTDAHTMKQSSLFQPDAM
mmetsp:Transcript_25699/g.59257  ORF Transcript_25699/g.59257 Transcript_25699/m.59257 type:complete len:274 (+) Transcript_25699:1801-2622(+)